MRIHRYIPLFAFALWAGTASSVPELPATPFVMEESPAGVTDSASNRISGNVQALDALFAQFTRLERGATDLPVSILQIGDSHVQAGFYPNRVRRRLQELFGDAGRGLVAPLKLTGTNQPPDYTVGSPNHWTASRCIESDPAESPGVTGMALVTDDPVAEFTITAQDAPFDRVRAFHHREAPLLRADDALAGEIGCPLDDTSESTMIPLWQTVTSVTLRAEATDPKYSRQAYYGFSLENGNRGILYHSTGINGNTFTAMNRHPQIIRQAVPLQPELLILSLGTNDSYGRNFDASEVGAQAERLIALLRECFPLCPLLLTTPMECSRPVRVRGRYVREPNPNSGEVRNEILRIAAKQNLPVWDFYTVAGGQGAMQRWNAAELAGSDQVHLTREGYQLQGDLLCRALIEAYNDYKAHPDGLRAEPSRAGVSGATTIQTIPNGAGTLSSGSSVVPDRTPGGAQTDDRR